MASLKYTDFEIKNLTKPLREKLNGRGNGVILFKKPDLTIEAYYLYWFEKKEKSIKIGNVKIGQGSGYSISEIRKKASQYADTKKKHPNLKEYLEYEQLQQKLEKQIKANTGTFKDLLDSYTNSLSNSSTRRTVENQFKRDVVLPFPDLAEKKASDILVNNIVLILKRILERNVITKDGKVLDRKVTTSGNRLRTYLSAAFNHAVKVTNDPLKQDKIFNVQVNPVSNIPKQTQYEKTQDRSLSVEEVKHLLTYIEKTSGVSDIVAKSVHFLFYIGGQRPLQLLRETWQSYDYRKKTLSITDTKGRGSKREYLTPLTPRALAILDGLPTQELPYPFTTDGNNPIRVETLLKAIQKYCKQYDVEKFTLRDIRRTCKNLMIDAGVNRETRNLIQNHALTGIDFKHYDKHDHLPEKIEGMAKYDRFLYRLLSEQSDNVVQLVTG